MAIEVRAQDVIDQLLAQNRQLVAEITVLRASLGMTDESNAEEQDSSN